MLIEAGFFHDSEEFLLVYFAVMIQIGFVDHFLQLLVGQIFAQFFGDPLQIFESNFTIFIVVKQPLKQIFWRDYSENER